MDQEEFDFYSVKKDLPAGDSQEEPNCQEWAVVDFGHGPTEVRCTRTDEHEEHVCYVEFVEEETSPDPSNN